MVIGLSGASITPTDKAAQHHTVGLFGQNPQHRIATAAGSPASTPPGSDLTPVATPGAPLGMIPAKLNGPALMPRSGLGAVPLQTSRASQKSQSSFVSVKCQGTAGMDGAQSDMYAVSDALLLDNISAAAAPAASQGSAGSKQSGCASRQTDAASSSSITPSTKGSQVSHSRVRLETFGLGWMAFWCSQSHNGNSLPIFVELFCI